MVLLQELVDYVRPVAHYIVLLLGVADGVRDHAEDFVGGSGVGPHYVHAHLLDCIRDVAQVHPQRPLDLIDVLKFDNRVANTTMDAQDSILGHLIRDHRTQRHPLEQIVHFLEHTVSVVNVLVEPLCALLAKAKILVHIAILMIAS